MPIGYMTILYSVESHGAALINLHYRVMGSEKYTARSLSAVAGKDDHDPFIYPSKKKYYVFVSDLQTATLRINGSNYPTNVEYSMRKVRNFPHHHHLGLPKCQRIVVDFRCLPLCDRDDRELCLENRVFLNSSFYEAWLGFGLREIPPIGYAALQLLLIYCWSEIRFQN